MSKILKTIHNADLNKPTLKLRIIGYYKCVPFLIKKLIKHNQIINRLATIQLWEIYHF